MVVGGDVLVAVVVDVDAVVVVAAGQATVELHYT